MKYNMAEKKSFEESILRLENIVKALESGETPLNESLKLFEEGVKLADYCNGLLEKAEQKVTTLVKGENGDLKEVPFSGDDIND